MGSSVLRRAEVGADGLVALVGRYRATLIDVADGAPLPGSYWGVPEAGLVRNCIYVHADTPVHSRLHELSHCVCMTADRRALLDRDAGGDTDEECAVCYLQLLLADQVSGFGRDRCFEDMDAWGYSFREGSVRAWFRGDGKEARQWLLRHALIDAAERPTWRLRDA
jgi:hypothetical protein